MAVSAAVTAIAPSNPESLFVNPLTRASALVNPEALDAALRAFSGVPEAPDIMAAVRAADYVAIGVTAHDVNNAMMDFHDASDIAGDHGGSLPSPTTSGQTLVQSGEVDGLGVGSGTAVAASMARVQKK